MRINDICLMCVCVRCMLSGIVLKTGRISTKDRMRINTKKRKSVRESREGKRERE